MDLEISTTLLAIFLFCKISGGCFTNSDRPSERASDRSTMEKSHGTMVCPPLRWSVIVMLVIQPAELYINSGLDTRLDRNSLALRQQGQGHTLTLIQRNDTLQVHFLEIFSLV